MVGILLDRTKDGVLTRNDGPPLQQPHISNGLIYVNLARGGGRLRPLRRRPRTQLGGEAAAAPPARRRGQHQLLGHYLRAALRYVCRLVHAPAGGGGGELIDGAGERVRRERYLRVHPQQLRPRRRLRDCQPLVHADYLTLARRRARCRPAWRRRRAAFLRRARGCRALARTFCRRTAHADEL